MYLLVWNRSKLYFRKSSFSYSQQAARDKQDCSKVKEEAIAKLHLREVLESQAASVEVVWQHAAVSRRDNSRQPDASALNHSLYRLFIYRASAGCDKLCAKELCAFFCNEIHV